MQTMAGLSGTIKGAMRQVAFTSGISSNLARRQNCQRILMLHGVSSKDVGAFSKTLQLLNQAFEIVHLARVIAGIRGEHPVTGREIALTFDDGLSNHFQFVYPVLQNLRAKATFFVCPGLMDSGKWLWNQEARARLHSLRIQQRHEVGQALGIGTDDVEQVIVWMKTLPTRERSVAENVIRDASHRFEPSQEQHEAYDPMSWNQAQALESDLVTVGSHTMSHPILTSLADDERRWEVKRSREVLAEKLSRSVDYFCYPNGSSNEQVVELVRQNYSAAVTVESASVTAGSLHQLPRVPATTDVSLLFWRLHRPTA